MARSRQLYNSASTPPVTGKNYMDAVQARVTDLWDLSTIPLTNVAGSANAITADADPVLTAGVTKGMNFTLVPVADITGAATIVIGGGATIPLKTDGGAALGAGQMVAGTMYILMADGTNLRVVGTSNILKVNDYQSFIANGTWVKPPGCPANALVTVKVWAGGGGGGSGANVVSGGGGGGYVEYRFRASDLPSSVSVTIGAGGSAGNAGGSSTFGALIQAFGGGAGSATTSNQGGAGGGGGGGGISAGGNGSATNGSGGAGAPGAASDPTAGVGGTGLGVGSGASPISQAPPGNGFFGGGGGGGSSGGNAIIGHPGGKSVMGGGGGAAKNGSIGGTSQFGGAGGGPNLAGSAPAGGGGSNAAGARGEVRVYVNG